MKRSSCLSVLCLTGLLFVAPGLGANGFAADSEVVAIQKDVSTTGGSRKPLSIQIDTETLTLTNDLAIAEAQAAAYPDNAEAQFLLAMAYSRSPHLEKAYHAFRRARKLIKHTPGGYANFDAKLAEYEAMLAYKPDDPLVLYRLGFGYFVRGYGVEENYIQDSDLPPEHYYALSEKTLERLLTVKPDDEWAMNYLGFLITKRDEAANADRAIALWEHSLAVNPVNPGACFLLGEAWVKKGNLRKGLEYGARAMEQRAAWEIGNLGLPGMQ